MINNDDNFNKELFDLHFSLKKKNKKIKKNNNDNKKQYNYYEYDLLLNRLHNNLKEQYPELNKKNNNTKKIPQIRSMITNKKTYWLNFNDFCNSITRDKNDVSKYIENNLKTKLSITGNNQLKINGYYKSQQLQNILSKYIFDNVRCKNCKCIDTYIKKDQTTRLFFLYCRQCMCNYSI